MALLDGVVRRVEGVGEGATDAGVDTLGALLRLLQDDPSGASAAGTAAAAGGWAGWRVIRYLAPFGVALYARIRKLDLAKHPARAMLLERIRAHPGLTTKDLLRRTKLNKGTALHHLRTLQRAGLLKSRRVGRDRAWFDPADATADAGALAALHAPMRQQLLDLAAARPGITQAELGREVGLARATVHHHVQALREAGLLEVRREGLRTRCFAARAAGDAAA